MLTLLKKTLQKPFLTLYGIESEKAYWSSSWKGGNVSKKTKASTRQFFATN